jgi:hypothetical protein
MPLFQTTIRSGFITDLILPLPTETKTPADVVRDGLATIFASIHDPNTMIKLNPLVQDVKPLLESDPGAVDAEAMCRDFGIEVNPPYAAEAFQQFEITDELNIAFGYTTDLVYHSAIRATKMGMQAFTDPGNGVRIFGSWEIKVADGDGDSDRSEGLDQGTVGLAGGKVIHIVERNETRCNVVLGWYIKSTLDKSHRVTHARLKERWIEKMKELGYKF